MRKKVAYIPLTKGKVAIVDHEDWALLSQYKWRVSTAKRKDGSVRTYYAITRVDGRHTYMHRLLMKPPDGLVVDHRDGNGLNNTKDNLRIATRGENNSNKHTKLGVSWGKRDKKWKVQIKKNGKCVVYLQISNKQVALRTYVFYAQKYHGEYAFIPTEAASLPPISEKEILFHRYTNNKIKTNTTGYVGVIYEENVFRVSIARVSLGSYDSDIWAARAFDHWSRILKKEKARLNFPKERYSWKTIWKHSCGYKRRPNYVPIFR